MLAILPAGVSGPATAASPLAFAPAEIADWPRRDFAGETRYRLVRGEGRAAVRALADDSATALYREVDVDLEETPRIEWSWRVEALPRGEASERTRAGDDYGARLYLVREGFFGKLGANALNYVHARAEPAGATWPNAYTGRARMLAVGSGEGTVGEWVTHRRDIRADWRKAFGEDVGEIHGIAIMTDADDTDTRARALYGTIRFLPADTD
ncbi:MAG: DUF3047 domain-containing protein [Halofilum sp. (in: g-proteobacteria)]|nr:DUF3047 domain-containing protein [Halofilum sp. (in: g-proteobacteria)]